jgi:hypothetical protein
VAPPRWRFCSPRPVPASARPCCSSAPSCSSPSRSGSGSRRSWPLGGAVPADVRGVALGIATLVFLVGGGLGSAVVGGIGELLGIDLSLLVLALLPVLGALALVPTLRAERVRT